MAKIKEAVKLKTGYANALFTLPKDFNLDDFMRYSFKVMHDEFYTVKVRISPGWARWFGEKIWHESQKITKLGWQHGNYLPGSRPGRNQALNPQL